MVTTKKERAERAAKVKGSDFDRVWFSLPVGMRRTMDGLTLSVLVDAVWRSWKRERAMVAHDLRVPTPRPATKLEVAL